MGGGQRDACAVTQKGPSQRAWFGMKLEASKRIGGVKLAMRTDCCPDQGQNVKVQIGSSMGYNANDPVCREIGQLSGSGLKDYLCDNVHEGQYVILSSPSHILTICEAKVMTG